jgi:dipeptidyl aminopeptidase/acylaminoacyl peptidase
VIGLRQRRRRRSACALLALACVLGVPSFAGSADPSPTGTIYFARLTGQLGGASEIAAAGVGGGSPKTLLGGLHVDGEALTVSPDGTRIAYATGAFGDTGGVDLWVMNVDGSNAHKVASNAGDPVWSPDGLHIAFAREFLKAGNIPQLEVFVCDPDGGNATRLTSNDADDNPLSWTADSKTVLFVTDRGGGTQTFAKAIGSTALATLWAQNAIRLSPDGTRSLVFVPDVVNHTRHLGVGLPDGTGFAILDIDDQNVADARWSPDSKFIVFARRDASNNPHISIIAAHAGAKPVDIADGDVHRELDWGRAAAAPAPVAPAVGVPNTRVSRTGVTRVVLTCPAAAAGGCAGAVTLTTTARVGRATYRLAAGASGSASVKLGRAAFTTLKRKRSLKVRVLATNGTASASITVRLRPPR